MIIVAGALIVDPAGRDRYLEQCASVVVAARQAPGCLDFALSPDRLDRRRINVFERCDGEENLHRFRGSGPDSDQLGALLEIKVTEYVVAAARRLTALKPCCKIAAWLQHLGPSSVVG